MCVIFHANVVKVEEMDRVCLVGFADDGFDTRNYLTLLRSFEDDEQDVRLGLNTYHVERNDQVWSGYGGIDAFELKPDRAKITFNLAGAIAMGNVSEMEITFQIDRDRFSALKECLGKIFAGISCPFG